MTDPWPRSQNRLWLLKALCDGQDGIAWLRRDLGSIYQGSSPCSALLPHPGVVPVEPMVLLLRFWCSPKCAGRGSARGWGLAFIHCWGLCYCPLTPRTCLASGLK